MNQELKRIDSSRWEYLSGEVEETLSWLSCHKWVVTGALLFVSAICWYNFIYVEKVPISIVSPSVVASASIIFPLMVVAVALLSIYSCIPIMVFFTSIEKGGNKFVAPKEEGEFKERSRSLFWRWILIQVPIWLAFLHAGPVDFADSLWILFVYFVGISCLAIFLLKTASSPAAVILAILIQMIIVFLVFTFSFEGVTDEASWQAYVVAFLFTIFFCINSVYCNDAPVSLAVPEGSSQAGDFGFFRDCRCA